MTRHPAFAALLALVCAWLAFLLLGPVLTIPLHIPINYNEGWNAGFDISAVLPGAGPLYPGPGSLVFNNYPPLGFLIVGEAGRALGGDMIMAGRIVALASLLGSAWLAGACVRLLGGAVQAAWASGSLLLLFACDFFRGYVAMDDPQWLAHALMLGGLAILLRGGTARLRDPNTRLLPLAVSALLVVAGGFVKHNLVALPISVALWLFWLDRRSGLAWLLSGIVAAGAGLLATEAAFGHAAFDDILHHRRVYRAHLLTHAIGRLAPLLPMAAIVSVLLRRRAMGDGAVFASLFCGVALVTGIVQRIGEGVYYNAHFETLIALCIAFGLALSPAFAAPAHKTAQKAGRPAALCVLAMLPVIGAAPWHLPIAWRDIADRHAREAAWRPVIARLAEADGPTGCLMLSVCAWAGKPFSVDLFNLTQSVLEGGPLAPFLATVGGHHWALFEDDPASFLHADAKRRLGHDPVMAGFSQAYSPVMNAPGRAVLLAPLPRDRSTQKSR